MNRAVSLPVIVFDGECGFCTMSARWLHRWVVRADVTCVVPWQRLDLAVLGLTADQCRASVQWVGADRQVASGHKAIAAALHGMTITPDKTPGILIEATWDDTGEIDRISFLGEVKDGKQVITETLPKLKK